MKRRDLWWLAFERAVGLALFFHPALWIARRATRYFRELACDDLAQMQSGLSPRDCAQAFLNIIAWSGRNQSSQTFTPQPLGLMDRYPVIQQRIMNMTELNRNPRFAALSRPAVFAIVLLGVSLSIPFAPKIVAMPQSPALKNQTLAKDHYFGGKVVDEKNKPVAGADVTFIYLRPAAVPEIESLPPVKTDAEGRWQVSNPQITLSLAGAVATKPGYQIGSIGGKFGENVFRQLTTGESLIQMKPGSLLKGKVVDSEGNPVSGAVVSHSPLVVGTNANSTTTNAAGEFTFREINSDFTQTLIATKPGFGAASGKIAFPGPRPVDFVLRLEKPRSVKILVTDEQGKPLSGVKAELMILQMYDFRRSVTTDSSGQIEFQNLP
ncbi:MAG: carboxypeptidase regulatory-like domain-containing protein, partial [bacterium]